MTNSTPAGTDRREIAQRDTRWAARLATGLHSARIRPNQISVASFLVAALAAAALILSAHSPDPVRLWLLLGAAAGIPVRLLLNMLDGLLAVEKGLHTPTGDLFNELPDRLADLTLLAAAGYATGGIVVTPAGIDLGVVLGWVAASAALLTAYVRTLGAANGVGNFFNGPLAKPARMWVLVGACLISLFEPSLSVGRGITFFVALAIIAIGSVATVIVRLRLVVRALHVRATAQGM